MPRSTAHLEPGQFWAFQLTEGRFACGCVLAKLLRGRKVDPQFFLAGLLDWSDTDIPTHGALAQARVLEQGVAHVTTIVENGRFILGIAALLGLHSDPIQRAIDMEMWDFRVIRVLAEKHFGTVS
ncbi:MAG: hypothetical protein ACREQP_17255 [Candidatus Binatia bacterium]